MTSHRGSGVARQPAGGDNHLGGASQLATYLHCRLLFFARSRTHTSSSALFAPPLRARAAFLLRSALALPARFCPPPPSAPERRLLRSALSRRPGGVAAVEGEERVARGDH
mmetsp:Transcript_62194/g.172175  ORF Transcript_62194/g.172175 Transcript_62194/m.172175 type:complete len:111 (+) Transcript_62194:507-839(+)